MKNCLKKVSMLMAILSITSQLYGQWESGVVTSDPMTGEKVAYASSPWVGSNGQPMIPQRINAALAVYHKPGHEWVSIVLSENLYVDNNFIKIWDMRIKWDDELTSTRARINQLETGSIYLADPEIISRIRRHGSCMVELKFVAHETEYFVFPLGGSSKAIAEMRTKLK